MIAVAGPRLTSLLSTNSKPSQADVLMAVFEDNYWPGRTPSGEPFATGKRQAESVAISLKGKGGLRQRLAVSMYALTSKQPGQEALSAAIGTIEGTCSQAKYTAPQALRAARKAGDAFLDLGGQGGQAVVISPGSWRVTDRPPVLFRRSGLTGELPPLPLEHRGAGSLDGTRHLFNIPDGGEWAAFVACRVASLLYPASTHPAEIFTSDTSGSLKTSTVRITKAWTDPGPFLPVPKDTQSWAATAGNVYAAAIDNVSWIPDWWSDLLCKAASGDAWAARALYTDGEAYSAEFSVVPLIDGIGLVSMRADLADRAVRHHLKRPGYYLGDDEAAQAWERGHQDALRWLLDLACQVAWMHAYGRVQRPRTGRLAEYEWVLATIDALWVNGGAGAAWLAKAKQDVAEDTIASDVLADAIAGRITAPWEGSAGELLAVIGYLAEENREPWSIQKAGKRMPRAADALTKAGWFMERREASHAKARRWVIVPPGWTWNGQQWVQDHPAPQPQPQQPQDILSRREDFRKRWNGEPPDSDGRVFDRQGYLIGKATGHWDMTKTFGGEGWIMPGGETGYPPKQP